jgi:hypothetical protein
MDNTYQLNAATLKFLDVQLQHGWCKTVTHMILLAVALSGWCFC